MSGSVIEAYRLGASFEDSGSVETLVVLYGVAVLDDAFGAAEGRWRTTDTLVRTLKRF